MLTGGWIGGFLAVGWQLAAGVWPFGLRPNWALRAIKSGVGSLGVLALFRLHNC